MYTQRVRDWCAALLLPILMAGCVPPAAIPPTPPPPTLDAAGLEGTRWRLVSLLGNTPLQGSELTLDFYADSYVEGDAGCNRYGSNYVLSGRSFRLSIIHRTDLECDVPDGVPQQEAVYLDALARTGEVRYWAERLELADAEGGTLLVFAPVLPAVVDPLLVDTEWVLSLLRGQVPLPDSRLTLRVNTDGLGGYTGCNEYGGEFESASGGVLKSGPIWRTAAGCATAALGQQEEAYVQALDEAASYRLLDDRLEIANERGETILVYARKVEQVMDPGDLVGTIWQLVQMDGQEWSGDQAATLAFHTPHLAGGHGGCSHYVATYQATGDDLRFLYMGMLGTGCDDTPRLAREGDYLHMLGSTRDYRLGPERLQLETLQGRVLLFAPLPEGSGLDLEGPTWSLLALIEGEGLEGETEMVPVTMPLLGTRISARFAEGHVSGSAGCNDYGAPYERRDQALSMGDVIATEKECPKPAGLMEQERLYLNTLRTVTGHRITGQMLWMTASDGHTLLYGAGG
jgi:heat shock protein HslJ